MDNNDALANLKPLIAPDPVTWWPPAPGWWLLGILLFCVFITLAMRGWKRWRHYRGTRYQREALQLLESMDHVADIALLIRRVAISAFGREHAATATWNEVCASMDEISLQLLTESQYRFNKDMPVDTIEHLRQQTELWIKKLPAVEH